MSKTGSGHESEVECLVCPAGKYAPGVLHTGNDPGSRVWTACQPCPAGTFAPAAGSQHCEVCPYGKFTHDATAASQTQPFIPFNGAKECLSCPPGRHHVPHENQCALCVPGTFSGRPGQVFCSLCPIGKYTGQHGSTSCRQCFCGPGKYMGNAAEDAFYALYAGEGGGHNRHRDAGAGAGQDEPGQQTCACNDCPAGRAAGSGGTVRHTGAMFLQCRSCALAHYAAHPGQQECSQCEPPTSSDPTQTK